MTIEDLLEKCEDAYSKSEYENAIEICDEILNEDLNNQIALGYKARCLYLMDENEKALTIAENALRLYPRNWHYLAIKADILADNGDYDDAIRCYEEIFKIPIEDESITEFMKRDCEICLSLKMDDLIERERYVEAWKCYNLQEKNAKLKRQEKIRRFKQYVKSHTTKAKTRQYYVKISSFEAKLKLLRFLTDNGFKSDDNSGWILLIDVIDKTCNSVSVDRIANNPIISESKFYDKVNYYPRNEIIYKKIYGEDGHLVYEGYTLDNAPYGFGKAYFANGNLYREGIFDIKGIVQGKEYYPSGRLRFEGQWSLTRGYGPNAPWKGNAYGENGELIYSGKFEIKRGGVGWPMIQKPKGFPLEQKERPKIDYY